MTLIPKRKQSLILFIKIIIKKCWNTMARQLQQEEGEEGEKRVRGRRATGCLGGCYGERTPAVRGPINYKVILNYYYTK